MKAILLALITMMAVSAANASSPCSNSWAGDLGDATSGKTASTRTGSGGTSSR